MRVIKPLTFDANEIGLTSSTVPENDHPEWVQGQSVALGDLRIHAHRIYEALQAGNPQGLPESTPAWWLDVGPTNRWAMLDGSSTTSTTASGSITVVLACGAFNSAAFVGLIGSTITVTTGGAGGTTTQALIPAPVAPATSSTLVVTGIDYAGGSVTIEIEGAGDVACASVSLGTETDLGETQMGLQIEVIDYSKVAADEFGTYRVVKRGYARRMQASVTVPYLDVDRVVAALSSMRQTPAMWTAADDIAAARVYGFYSDWSLAIATPTQSTYSITIESLALSGLGLLPGDDIPAGSGGGEAAARTIEAGTFRYTEDGTMRVLE